MMTEQDQAQKLRELVRQTRGNSDAQRRHPVVVALVGCCPGVGATTITNRLAAILAKDSIRVEVRSDEDLRERSPLAGDIVLVDCGAGCSQEFASLWNRTDMVLLVITSAREALLETYGTLKMAKLDNPDLPVYLLPNRCNDERDAQMIHERITQSCERFLGFAVPAAPWQVKFHDSENRVKQNLNPNLLKLARFVRERSLAGANGKISVA